MQHPQRDEEEIKALIQRANTLTWISTSLFTVAIFFWIFSGLFPNWRWSEPEAITAAPIETVDRDLIVDGIHVRTGLKEADGMFIVIANCTNCHSAKLVTQNRMNESRWKETIKWMQETQGLWDLGENEDIIVNYLVSNYPPVTSNGRRANLTDIEWYEN